MKSVFGKVCLGYVVVESCRLDAWRRFGTEGLGLHCDEQSGQLQFRIDDHEARLIVTEGPREDVIAIGWQVADTESLNELELRLRARGAELRPGSPHESEARRVGPLWWCLGPKRQRIELFITPRRTDLALQMRASGFVTGAGGMGHMAITTREPEAMQAFWREVFDARISDHIDHRVDGVQLELTFLRLNQRHHSIATAATRGWRINPMRTAIHHLNLEVASLEDVISGYLRCRSLGYGIANSIGQHPNDLEISFYVETPSGFDMELGWNALDVQEQGWKEATHQGMSRWGHFPENLTLAKKLVQLGRGLASLTQPEYVVPPRTA